MKSLMVKNSFKFLLYILIIINSITSITAQEVILKKERTAIDNMKLLVLYNGVEVDSILNFREQIYFVDTICHKIYYRFPLITREEPIINDRMVYYVYDYNKNGLNLERIITFHIKKRIRFFLKKRRIEYDNEWYNNEPFCKNFDLMFNRKGIRVSYLDGEEEKIEFYTLGKKDFKKILKLISKNLKNKTFFKNKYRVKVYSSKV